MNRSEKQVIVIDRKAVNEIGLCAVAGGACCRNSFEYVYDINTGSFFAHHVRVRDKH